MTEPANASRDKARNSGKVAGPRCPRPEPLIRTSRGRIAAALLAITTLAGGVAGASGAFDKNGIEFAHGEAQLFFPPWVSEPEAIFRIHRAGGVPISDPGEPSGRVGMFRAITARDDFAARIREEGALFVLF